VIRKIIFRAGL